MRTPSEGPRNQRDQADVSEGLSGALGEQRILSSANPLTVVRTGKRPGERPSNRSLRNRHSSLASSSQEVR